MPDQGGALVVAGRHTGELVDQKILDTLEVELSVECPTDVIAIPAGPGERSILVAPIIPFSTIVPMYSCPEHRRACVWYRSRVRSIRSTYGIYYTGRMVH